MSKTKKNECPYGGDSCDCGNCAYGPDYAWDDKIKECVALEPTEESTSPFFADDSAQVEA